MSLRLLTSLENYNFEDLLAFHKQHFGDAVMTLPDPPADGGTTTDPEGSGTTGEEAEGGEKPAEGETPRERALREEKDRHFQARKRAEQEQATLAQRLKAIEDKDKTELERATSAVQEKDAKIKELEDALKQERLNNAFLSSNDFAWHDPEDALRLADMSAVEIADDGKVKGLKEALKALAERKPHLVKPKESGGDPPPASGSAMNGGKGKGPAGLTREQLAAKYPALRR